MSQKEYYETFNKVANWQNLQRYLSKRSNKFLFRINLRQRGTILDVGCGKGFFHSSFQENYKHSRTIGIDLSFRQCSLGKDNFPECQFIVGDAKDLPFRSKEFNLVFANALLHHVSNPKRVIDEMIRVCEPSGHVVVVEQNKFNPLIALLSLVKQCERNTLDLSIPQIKTWLRNRAKGINVYPINSYIYPYHSFPPRWLRKITETAEDFFEIPLLCTHYIIIAGI